MKRVGSAVVLGILAGGISFGQVGPLRTGFAVVTPITGGKLAFSVTETFTERFDGSLLQSIVQPSPLATLTSMVVNSDPASGKNTGIAILDPFDVPANVTLTLVDRQGVIIGARIIIIERRQQRSRFLTELFAGVPELTESFTGQLFISSDIPVAVLALAFSGPFFTAVPATQLSGIDNLAAGNLNGALFLPQVASGGGWVSTITVANTSILPQSVRIDFFDSTNGSVNVSIAFSIPNTIVQAGGVVTFSTAR